MEAAQAVQVDAGHRGARDADEAILGPEPRDLEGVGVEHLGEGEREHDEVHAAHPDREEADRQRGEAGGHRGQQQGRDQPRAPGQGQRGHVAPDAEERGVAEGHHARVAHQEVEAHGEDPPDENLLQELHRVVAGREREEGQRDHHQRGGEEAEAGHLSGRPNSPCGRTSTIAAITT